MSNTLHQAGVFRGCIPSFLPHSHTLLSRSGQMNNQRMLVSHCPNVSTKRLSRGMPPMELSRISLPSQFVGTEYFPASSPLMAAVAATSSLCTGSPDSRAWVIGCLVLFSFSRPGDVTVPGKTIWILTSKGAGACLVLFFDRLAPLYIRISERRESARARRADLAGP